jgi:hypothetical protein
MVSWTPERKKRARNLYVCLDLSVRHGQKFRDPILCIKRLDREFLAYENFDAELACVFAINYFRADADACYVCEAEESMLIAFLCGFEA